MSQIIAQSSKRLKNPKLASANLIAFIVAACGGGGGGSSTPIIPSNSAPSAGADITVTFTEDVNAGLLNLSAPTDSDGDTLTISVTGIPTSGTLNKADGTLIASGDSLTSAELQGLTFTPDANANDSTTSFGTFDYSVSDGNGGTDTRTVTISVEAVNDAPSFDITVTEVAVNENTTAVTTINATDVEGDAITYSISGGDDKDLFQIDSASGELSFISAPNYEIASDSDIDNIYQLTVSATDPSDASTSLSYVITVNDSNDAPTDISLSSLAVPENTAGSEVGTLSVTDEDLNDTFTYEISGTDADKFELSGSSLKLKTSESATYGSSYSISVSATDNSGLTVSKDFTIEVLDKIETLSLTDSSITENSTEVGTFTTDSLGSVTYSISGGSDSSNFSISGDKLIFTTAPDYETPSDQGKNNQHEVIVTATDTNNYTVSQTFTVSVVDENETVTGVLIDGYVAGATVFQDLDNDGVLDVGEPSTTTDATGAFTLTLQSPSPNAPVRVINSGFDTAANDLLRAILDISATTSGEYILTPLSTLHARLLALDTSLYKDDAEKLVADLFGITLSNVPNSSLFGYDPIATMAGSGDEATKAQTVYTANQLLMTLGHLMSSLGTYIGPKALDNAETAIQSLLDNAGISATANLSWGDTTDLKSQAHDALTNALATYLKENKSATITDFLADSTALADILAKTLVNIQDYLTKTIGKILNDNSLTIDGTAKTYTTIIDDYTSSSSFNGFRMDSGTVTLTDYLDSNASTTNTHKLYSSMDSSTITANLVGGTMDQTNLSSLVSSNSSTGKSPILSFALDSIPNAGESGTASVTMKLYDGSDATKSSGERLLETTVSVNWSSDGTTVTFTLPSQSLDINYHSTDGSILERTYTNASPDILEVTKAGPDYPATLDIRVASFFSGKGDSEGVDLTGYISSGDYFYEVSFSGLNFKDSSDNSINKFQGAFTVADTPGVTAYAEDITIGETGETATVTVTLSKASSSAVTIDYQTVDGTALAGSDYTASSGTLTIAAGSTSGTFTIPIASDDIIESNDSFTVNLSNPTNTTLGKSAVTVSITDNTTWVKTYTEAFTSGATKSLTSFISAIDSYIDNASSGSPTAKDLATALTKINVGIKAIDFSQVMGSTLISDSGTFESGVAQSSFDTNLSGKVTTVITAAADTIGDVLGTETAASFPNATIKILSDGDDTADGTANSDLIATLLGDDTVNGLAGNDKIIGGSGIDTFNGGEGDDHLYGYTGNDVLTGDAGNDKIIGGLGDDTLTGGEGNDILWGQTGNDTITTGAGSDDVDGGLGDDTIYVRDKSGSYTDTIKGSAGTDTLDISYSGITSLKDFTLSSSGDEITLTDASGGSITFSNIENLTVNSIAYLPPPSDPINSGDGGLSNAFYSTAEKSIISYGSAVWYVQNLKSSSDNYIGFGGSDDVTFAGSSSQETLNLNINRTTEYSGNLTITMGDGNDSINSAKLKNTDSIDMGAGDDTVSLMINGSYGTPTIGAANFTKLDGGAGTDTLKFEEGTPDAGTELTLTTGGAVNFENLTGGSNAEVLKGDNNANVLTGKGGADTLYGYGGNDTLNAGTDTLLGFSGSTNDILYGGAGNDTLLGTDGDNTLDGGTGADTITSGGGVDTFVIRVGSGGSAITDADTFTDFTDGTDLIGLDNSLTFSDLTIEQGTGSYSSHTIVKAGSEYLAIVQNITASDLTESSFTPVNINESGTENASLFVGSALSLDNSSLSFSIINNGNLTSNKGKGFDIEGLSFHELPIIEIEQGIELKHETELSESLLNIKLPKKADSIEGYSSHMDMVYEYEETLFVDSEILV